MFSRPHHVVLSHGPSAVKESHSAPLHLSLVCEEGDMLAARHSGNRPPLSTPAWQWQGMIICLPAWSASAPLEKCDDRLCYGSTNLLRLMIVRSEKSTETDNFSNYYLTKGQPKFRVKARIWDRGWKLLRSDWARILGHGPEFWSQIWPRIYQYMPWDGTQ
jgi:hypothetical protein